MFCNRCGHLNPAAATFCSSCGAALDVTLVREDEAAVVDTEHHEHIVPEVVGRPCLVVEGGHRGGTTFPMVADAVEIGRHPDSDIFLDDITVSRRHATVRVDGARVEVADAGSLNGTYVNRQRVEVIELHDGDELQIGKFKLVLLLPRSSRGD